jgi:hypothetical protein
MSDIWDDDDNRTALDWAVSATLEMHEDGYGYAEDGSETALGEWGYHSARALREAARAVDIEDSGEYRPEAVRYRRAQAAGFARVAAWWRAKWEAL